MANFDSKGRRKAENPDLLWVRIACHSSLLIYIFMQIFFIFLSNILKEFLSKHNEELCHLGDIGFQENKVENKN